MLLSDKTILVFEDNLMNITVHKTLLQASGATVQIFIGGDIYEIVRLLPIHLIIMDLMIPGTMDGFDFFEVIHQHPELKHIPVVAVSAMDPSLAISKAQDLGFAGFISKPIKEDIFPQQLLDIMNGEYIWFTT